MLSSKFCLSHYCRVLLNLLCSLLLLLCFPLCSYLLCFCYFAFISPVFYVFYTR